MRARSCACYVSFVNSTMADVSALGLLQNDPHRGPVALRTLDAIVGIPELADAAGVATVVDGAALVSRGRLPAAGSSRAAATGRSSWAAVVGAPRGRASVVQLGAVGDVRPAGVDQSLNLGPFRARAYAAAIVGGPQDADAAAASRERLLRDVPDFLRRCVVGRSEGEAFLLAVLARVHARGLLDAAHDNVAALLDATQAVLDASAADGAAAAPRHVTLTNGVEVLHVARGSHAAIVTVAGLADDVAAGLDPALADSSTARERNRRYRAVFVLGGLTGPLPDALPRGFTVDAPSGDAVVVVGRDLVARRA
jgi:hypothetical protein